LIAKSHRWQKTALAAAAIALLGLSGNGAHALSLGRITVLSALGEPLRAEVDVPDINAEEAASLKAGVAGPQAFVSAGLEYNPAMSGLQATLQRRADGRAFIRLTSDRAINDPFVDLILEASWSSGRIVRDYTMLFDPPAMRQPSTPAPTLAQTAPAVSVTQTKPTGAFAASPPSTKTAPAPVATKPAARVESDNAKTVTVKSGDTASKIAARTKAVGVSLDQMLVALLRANPDAFVNSNINRIRSGTVMNVPDAEQAKSVSAAEATRVVIAQSKDFNDFRRNLASNAPTAAVGTADRKASGAIETKVEDKKPASATPDKLTLSKGTVQSKADDARIAKERADKDAATRAAEIAKNISDLNKIGAASAAKAAASVPPAATKPASAPAAPAAVAPVLALPASAPAPIPAPMASEPVSAPAKPAAKIAVPVPAPVEEPGLLDELIADPLVPAGGVGLLALLGGFAFWRIRQKKKNATQVDSSFLESRLQPDSFFGASGGQRVDTNNDGAVSNSSMVYTASQLDAADDVDPVAEADVYLAYGRDLQAEEILKEAARTNPGRLAIHTKLLEIFAKRRDAAGFEASALQAFKLAGAGTPDWTRICEMGLAFDAQNPLYQPGVTSVSAFGGLEAGTGPSEFGSSTVAQSAHPDFSESKSVDLDLDLDFSLDDEPASAISDVTGGTMSAPPASEQTVKMEAPSFDNGLALDFDVSDPVPLSADSDLPEGDLPEISLAMDSLNLIDDHAAPRMDFAPTGTMPPEPTQPPPVVADKDHGMLEFDMGSLSLDLDTPSEQPSEAPSTTGEDPLETKLALADEFISIGDEDGARALIEEVIAEATGDMRAKAQRALANLS
jgi:pilus assembly protein FimV